MLKIGVVVISSLIEAVPPVKKLFELRHKNMKLKDVVRYHGELVMGSVDKAVMFLDDPEKMESFMHEVGDRHAEITVRLEYMDCFIPFFIQAIRPTLNERWASSIEDAWAAFFRRIIHFIKESTAF